jgi:gluconolactonase
VSALWLAATLLLGAVAGSAEVLRADPRFDALVARGAALEKLADGFGWIEGPVWSPAHGGLLFSDVARNRVHLWRPGAGVLAFLERSGYTGSAAFAGPEPGSNGLALDPQGRLVLCQHGDRRIARLEADGTRSALVERFEGRRLNSPNDLVFARDGALYFTDPPFGLPGTFGDPERELAWSGVYRLRPGGRLELLTRELPAPNGIGLAPDGRTLYVANAERERPVWLAFELRADGSLGPGRVLHDGRAWAERWPGAPDGLEVDRDGNLWAAGPGGVHVIAPDGTHLGSLVTDVATGNVAFGPGGRELYVAAGDRLWRLELASPRLP